VFIYQFDTAAGAKADYQRTNAFLDDILPPGSTTFTIDGLPDGESTAIVGSAADMSAGAVKFTTGVYNLQVICNAPACPDGDRRPWPGLVHP
jgi:hypothetical protein